MLDSAQEILNGLEPLIQEAERKGLWLESTYQNIPFSPRELRTKNKNGEFVWGKVNWRLIDPKTLLRDIPKLVAEAEKHNAAIMTRIRNG